MEGIVKLKNGNRMHYLMFGKGKPVILLPSMFLSSKSYTNLGRELGKYYKVYLLDLFKGNSILKVKANTIKDYVDGLSQTLTALKLKDYYLIGISLSGVIATYFTMHYTPLPKKLFLVSTTVATLNARWQGFKLTKGYVLLLLHNLYTRTGRKINSMWIKDGLGFAVSNFRQIIKEAVFAKKVKIEKISKMQVPTKLLFAQKDEYLPSGTIKSISDIKNLEVEVVDGYHGWFFGNEKILALKVFKFFGN